MKQAQARLKRTPADTLRWYLTTRVSRTISVAAAVAVVGALGAWQYPNAAATVQQWAADLSGRDATLTAQSELSDALNHAQDVAELVEGDVVDATELGNAVLECEPVRSTTDVSAMKTCTVRLITASDRVSADVARYDTAVQVVALGKQAADANAKKAAEEKAAADAKAEQERLAAEKAALEAQRIAAEQEAQRIAAEQEQNTWNGGDGDSGNGDSGSTGGGEQPYQPPAPEPPASQGSTLSTTVTCSSRQTVSASASGGGTVTVTISGAGSGSDSGSGGASASATGSGTFTITATSTGDGLSLNPSWTGSCY